jgi:hypothetical protein
VEWIEKLQAPGLILAGFVIWLLYQLIRQRDSQLTSLAAEVAENSKTISRMATYLEIICKRIKDSDGGGRR